MDLEFILSVSKQFAYYKSLGQNTFDQLEDKDLFWRPDAEANSIAILVNHLWGNMMSRWTDFLTSDGEKQWRKRDVEFEDVIKSRQDLQEKWNQGWDCLFTALETINSDNLDSEVTIRNQAHSIPEALIRQMAHYAYHVGQIVYVGRMLRGEAWVSLSIPKGKSKEFNQSKFSKGKHRGHFTDGMR